MAETQTQRPDDAASSGGSASVDGSAAASHPLVRSTSLPPPDAPARPDPNAAAPTGDGVVRLGGSGPVSDRTLTRRGRIRKWDREPQPRDWRFFVGGIGKTLISVGLLMFGFVGYQLYGTGIETAAAQSRLEDEFEQQLALVEPVSPDFVEGSQGSTAADSPTSSAPTDPETDGGTAIDATDAVPSSQSPAEPESEVFTPAGEDVAPPAVPADQQNIPVDLENGDALAKIEIERIGVSDIVVAGVDIGDLKRGPGHFPDTPLPGQLGNAAIAGHRTTYGQPFRNVNQLQAGDEIKVTTLSGVFVYRVTGQRIVAPSEYQVVATTDPTKASLTLTSCHPVFTARERIVIFSELDRVESDPVGEPVINYGRPEAAQVTSDEPAGDELASEGDATTTPTPRDTGAATSGDDAEVSGTLTEEAQATDRIGTDATNAGIADAFSDSWFSDSAANPQVGMWGIALGSIAIAAYALSRRFRSDLLGLAVGIIPFTVALYFFFQNVNRLLPPNL